MVPVVKNNIGQSTKPVCKMFLALCCHLHHGFALAITLQLGPWTSSSGNGDPVVLLSHLFDSKRCSTFCSGHLHLPLIYTCVPGYHSYAVSLALPFAFLSQTLGRIVAVLCMQQGMQGLWPWKRFCEVIPPPWTMGNEREEKQDLDSVSWKRFGQTSLTFPDSSCGASSLVPRAQHRCL